MNDTELRSHLQRLVDPPLDRRPSRSQLEDRVAGRTRRRRAVIAAAAAVVLIAAGAFVVSAWPWTRSVGFVQVDDPMETQEDQPRSSDKAPSEMSDAELAAELDRILRSEQIADGVHFFFGLSAELLGGQGDPRGVDTWWSQTSFATPAELASGIDEYVAEGLVRNPALDRPGYLEGEDRIVALLREVADRVRDMPPPERPPYPQQDGTGDHRVPVPEMAGYGDQQLVDATSLGEVLVAVGQVGDKPAGRAPSQRPAVLLSSDRGASWEDLDLSEQGLDGWRLETVATDGRRVAVGGQIDDNTGNPRPAVAVSDNGRDWQPLRSPDGAIAVVRDLTITADGTLVAVGWQRDPFGPAAWVSHDWRTLIPADVPDDEPGRFEGVASGAAGLIAVGNQEADGHPRIWRSDDGSSWQRIPAADVGIVGGGLMLRGIDYLEGYAGGVYVANVGSRTGQAYLWTSSDGEDWQAIEVELGHDEAFGIVSDVSVDDRGRLLAVGGIRDRTPDPPWPRTAWWVEDPNGERMRLAGARDSHGIMLGAHNIGGGILVVGEIYPPNADASDGAVWDLDIGPTSTSNR